MKAEKDETRKDNRRDQPLSLNFGPFRGLAWTRVKPGERREEKHTSCFAIKAKRAIVARVLKPPVLYRAPSWTWASVDGPIAINEAFFYFAKRRVRRYAVRNRTF